jgi:hypothetical protein
VVKTVENPHNTSVNSSIINYTDLSRNPGSWMS